MLISRKDHKVLLIHKEVCVMADLKILGQMCSKLDRIIDGWITKTPMLGKGERLVVTIQVKPKKKKGFIVMKGQINDSDWKKIFSLPWTQREKVFLEEFKVRGNKPIPRSELIEKFLRKSLDGVANGMFRRHKLPYRFLKTKRASINLSWLDEHIKLFVVSMDTLPVEVNLRSFGNVGM